MILLIVALAEFQLYYIGEKLERFAEVNDVLVVIAGENKKEHEYLIPKSKVSYFDEKQLHVSISDNSLKDFEI